MNEIEYIHLTNLTYLRIAMTVLGNCLQGDEYGVPTEDFREAYTKLMDMTDSLSKRIKTDET